MRNGTMAGYNIPCTRDSHKQVDVVSKHYRKRGARKEAREKQEAIHSCVNTLHPVGSKSSG